MNTLNTKELEITYSVISKIMKEENLNHDNSFIRVKNWISCKICDILIKNNNDYQN